jgi:hypothetical protein
VERPSLQPERCCPVDYSHVDHHILCPDITAESSSRHSCIGWDWCILGSWKQSGRSRTYSYVQVSRRLSLATHVLTYSDQHEQVAGHSLVESRGYSRRGECSQRNRSMGKYDICRRKRLFWSYCAVSDRHVCRSPQPKPTMTTVATMYEAGVTLAIKYLQIWPSRRSGERL